MIFSCTNLFWCLTKVVDHANNGFSLYWIVDTMEMWKLLRRCTMLRSLETIQKTTFMIHWKALAKRMLKLSKCNFNDSNSCWLLLSRSSLEPLISLDLVGTKLYCFRARVHCYHCLYTIFSINPVRCSEELLGGPFTCVELSNIERLAPIFRANLIRSKEERNMLSVVIRLRLTSA